MVYAFYWHCWAGYIVVYRHHADDENEDYDSWHLETLGMDGVE